MARNVPIGLSKTRIAIERLGKALSDERMEPVLLDCAKVVSRNIAAKIPVLKKSAPHRIAGALRDSMREWAKTNKEHFPSAFSAIDRKKVRQSVAQAGGKDTFYGRFVEAGTRFMAGFHYFRDGVRESRPIVRRMLIAGCRALINNR